MTRQKKTDLPLEQRSAVYNSLLDEIEKDAGLSPVEPGSKRQLSPAAYSHLDFMMLAALDPHMKQRRDEQVAALQNADGEFAQELATSLAYEGMTFETLRQVGYKQSDLEEIQHQIPLRSQLGRTGFMSEILAIIREDIIEVIAPANKDKGQSQQADMISGRVPDMRKSKRKLESFRDALTSFEDALLNDTEVTAFIQKSFYRASGARPGKYRSLSTQTGWLRRRVFLLRLEIAQILHHAPKRGRQADESLSGEIGQAVEASPHQQIAMSLGWAWMEWMGRPPTRITRQVPDDSPHIDGTIPTEPDGSFLKIVQVVVKPLGIEQTFDAAARNVVSTLSLHFEEIRKAYPLIRQEIDD